MQKLEKTETVYYFLASKQHSSNKTMNLNDDAMFNKISIAIIAVFILFLAVGGPQAKPSVDEQSFSVAPGGTLYLDSDMGSVEVESHDSEQVDVMVTRKGDAVEDFTIEMSQEGDDVRIKGDKQGGWGSFRGGAKYVIRVPQKYNVDLRTGGGAITLADLNGRVDVNTSGGSIGLGRIKGDVKAHTSGGSIRVKEVAGNINATTSGGSIKATLSQQPTANCRLKTSGGSVTAYLAPSIAVNLDARTAGGSVRSELEVDGTRKRTRIKGTINGGGPTLELKTSGGSVRIKSL